MNRKQIENNEKKKSDSTASEQLMSLLSRTSGNVFNPKRLFHIKENENKCNVLIIFYYKYKHVFVK